MRDFFGIIQTYYKQALAYRAEYLVSILTVPLRFLFITMIWTAVYLTADGSMIAGYSLPNLITYFMITTLVFTFTYDTIDEDFEREVRMGNFLTYLLKPMSFFTLGIHKKIAERSFAFLIEIAPITLIFILFFKQYFIVGIVGYFLISIALAFFIAYFIYFLIGTLSFWLVNIRSISWLLDFGIKLSAGFLVPLDLFPPLIKSVLDVLPFKYIAYVPTSIYLGKFSTDMSSGLGGTVFEALGYQLLWAIALLFLALFIWKKGVKRFSGVGA